MSTQLAASTPSMMPPCGPMQAFAHRPRDLDAITRRRAQQIQAFMADAERAVAADDLESATTACEEILVRDADHEGALACLESIHATLESRRLAAEREGRCWRLAAVCDAARDDIDAGRFRHALERIVTAQREEGPWPADDHEDAAGAELRELAARARDEQAEAEHREAVAAAVNDQIVRAARLFAAGDHQGALTCIEAALTLDPSHTAATALHVQMRDTVAEPTVLEPQVITIDGDQGDPLALFASEAETPAPAPPAPQIVKTAHEVRPAVQHRVVRPAPPTPVVARAPRSARPSMAIAALLILIPGAGGLWSAWHFTSPGALPTVAAATVDQPTPALRAAAAPAGTEPAIPAAKAPVPSRPSTATDVNELVDQAQQHLARGDRTEAVSVLTRAASIAPGDPQLRRVVDDALTGARASAAQARSAASANGVAGAAGYQDTDARGLEAARLERAGSRVRALSLWWEAADGYTAALRDSRAAAPIAEAAPAPPAPAGPSADERMVRSTMQAYVAAYSALDVEGVRAVFPGASEPALRRVFNALQSQQVEMRNEQMAVAGDAATVACTLVTSSVGAEAGSVAVRDSRRAVFNLAKRDDTWVVVERR